MASGREKEEVDTDLQTGSNGPTEKGLNQPSLPLTPPPSAALHICPFKGGLLHRSYS